MNWKVFCLFGILWSILFGVWAYTHGNMLGVRFQMIIGLAYAAGYTYLSLKEKKKDD